MVDFVKVATDNQRLINDLFEFAKVNLTPFKAQNNHYLAFSNNSARFRFEFRKALLKGELLGFRSVEVCFSPHYLFNNDQHNGNDFNPLECIEVINSVVNVLGVKIEDLKEFTVCNIEFGLNLQINNVSDVLKGLIYTRRTEFKTKGVESFKISDTTNHKEIKAYDKGIQFKDFPSYGIPNTFRFEVRMKKSRAINTLGIYTIGDLLDVEKYKTMLSAIIDEWQNVLVINPNLKTAVNRANYWKKLIDEKQRNAFNLAKKKYYKNIRETDNLHQQIGTEINYKINKFWRCADSPQKTLMNKGKSDNEKRTCALINGESAHIEGKNKAENKSKTVVV